MEGFKKRKSKHIRRRKSSDNSEDDNSDKDTVDSTIEDLKEVQRSRKKHYGICAEDLNAVKVKAKEIKIKVDTLKLETGGYVDYQTIQKGMTDELEEQIGTAFASETNRRDEDTEMLKYVDEEMAKIKGHVTEEDQTTQKRTSDEAKLYELPEHLKNLVPSKKRKEDMISNQMLSGIPEVDLGIEAKIKNIEQTEDAKQQLILEKQRKNNTGASAFVPTNYAVNFIQHNRFNIEDDKPKYRKPLAAPEPTPLRVGDVERLQTDELAITPTPGPHRPVDKATDDYHFEKFRRQNRKY